MIVYLARDIPPFVMYCVNGKPRSSLLKESTDSMIDDDAACKTMKVKVAVTVDVMEPFVQETYVCTRKYYW